MTETKIVATYTKYGKSTLILIDNIKKTWKDLQLPLDDITSDAIRPLSSSSFLVIGRGVTTTKALYRVDLYPKVVIKKLRDSSSVSFPASIFSKPEHIRFPTSNNKTEAHGYFHAPYNPRFHGPNDSLPPLIISSHGGPTSHFSPGLDLETHTFQSYVN